MTGLVTGELELHQGLGAELGAQFQEDLLAPPIDQLALGTGCTELNYATAPQASWQGEYQALRVELPPAECCNRDSEPG